MRLDTAGFGKCILVPIAALVVFARVATASSAVVTTLQIVSELGSIKAVLSQVGPILSAVMFIVAGVFYALGQIMPPDKKANFHSTAINIIIGAVVVGVLSVASTSLATASAHLLSNVTANSTA
ncbi:hypothetical protein M1397_02180 [Candidatus Marsarchaeota archaeon]|nr:hypothetical protein [Candidatus Marsarchaeota archaeon]